MEPFRTSSSVFVRPRPVTSRYGGPGDTPAKRRAARQQRRLRAYRIAQTIPHTSARPVGAASEPASMRYRRMPRTS